MDIANIEKAAKLMEEAQDCLRGGPFSFYLRELAASYNLLMERFCPYKVGSRVQLAKTPNITEQTAPGWMSCRHFLVKGAKGTVNKAYCGEGGFYFYVEFDDDSWIDPHTKVVRPTENKYVFTFKEADLVPASTRVTQK
jgi:hypothetical protein